MEAIKKRKFAFNLQLIVTVVIFFMVYGYMKREINLYFLIGGGLAYVGVTYYRFSIIKKNFYIQKVKKSKYLEILNKLLPIIALIALIYIPDFYAINAILGALLFNASVVINERYTKYISIEEYNKRLKEYNKNKGKNKKKK